MVFRCATKVVREGARVCMVCTCKSTYRFNAARLQEANLLEVLKYFTFFAGSNDIKPRLISCLVLIHVFFPFR